MVKITGKTNEEKELEEKVKNLFNITSKMFTRGQAKLYLDEEYINVYEKIHIHCYRNLIKVDKEQYFDDALKLAEAYEKEIGEKWTLKRMYE